jgi:predicted kinase
MNKQGSNEIILLVGNIASGKSTLVRRYAAKGYLIINDDSLVSAIHGGCNKTYDKKLKPLYKAIEECIFSHGAALGKSIVIDRPNMSIATRSRYIGMARSRDMSVSVIVMPMQDALIHAKRRYNNDCRGLPLTDWDKAAIRLANSYEAPSLKEGIDQISYLSGIDDD